MMESVPTFFLVTLATVLISTKESASRIHPDARPCFQFFCRCEKLVANCSYNGDKLTFIPKLMSWVTQVNLFYFDSNHLEFIANNTMDNLTDPTLQFDVMFIEMKNNNIKHIEAGAFRKFQNLVTLDLSDNPLIVKTELQATFFNMPKSFAYVYLNGLHITDQDLNSSLLGGLKQCTMSGIHLKGNNITVFDFNQFADFPDLVTLSLESNRIDNVSYINRSSASLSTLWLNDNRLTEIPYLCRNGRKISPAFPNLYSLSLDLNNISFVAALNLPCLKNVNKLWLSGNSLVTVKPNAFEKMSKLTLLNISRNREPLEIERSAFSNGVLKTLILADSNLTYLSDDAFRAKNHACILESIDLSFTNFTGYARKLFVLLNPCSATLTSFKCSGCNLTNVPLVLSVMPNLKEVILDRNKITGLRTNAFNKNRKLITLDLSNNSISRLSGSSLPVSVRKGLKKVSLEGNPFYCDCDLLWLKEWLERAKSLFRKQLSFYTCHGPPSLKGKILVNVASISPDACHSDKYTLANSFCAVGTVLLCLTCFALGYKWSWNVRYCLKWGHNGTTTSDECQILLTTDAYVLYCDEDFMFVRHQILPNLEERGHLKLCFRSRDFNPKVHVVDNIANNLRRSKKVLFVVSNSFFKDTRAKFELYLVKKHLGKQGQGSLMVVMLEDIEPRYMSHDLDQLMGGRESIRWVPANGLVVWQFLLSHLRP